jgi:poly(A) polymerase
LSIQRSNEEKTYGVTEAISKKPPTPEDLASTDKLIQVLASFNLFESQDESDKRQEVLGKLNLIIKEWIREVSIKRVCLEPHTTSTLSTKPKPNQNQNQNQAVDRQSLLCTALIVLVTLYQGHSESTAAEVGGKLCTFGSYRLGVHNPGSDIDALCICPRHIDRNEDFFGPLKQILAANPEVTELTCIPDAYVPVMNFCFSGVPVCTYKPLHTLLVCTSLID